MPVIYMKEIIALILVISVVAASMHWARIIETRTASEGILLGEVMERWRKKYACDDLVVMMVSSGARLKVDISCKESYYKVPSYPLPYNGMSAGADVSYAHERKLRISDRL